MSDAISTKTDKICEFPSCGRPRSCKRFCRGHYTQCWRNIPLVPLKTKRPKGAPPRIEYDEVPCPKPELEGPCHIFKHCKSRGRKGGYGQVGLNGKNVKVHRYVWERDVGPIPKGFEIDHICRVRACCNVKHLRVVNDQQQATENSIGAFWQTLKKRTHCPKGHEYTQANTYVWRGMRDCRECSRIRDRKRAARKRGKKCVVS